MTRFYLSLFSLLVPFSISCNGEPQNKPTFKSFVRENFGRQNFTTQNIVENGVLAYLIPRACTLVHELGHYIPFTITNKQLYKLGLNGYPDWMMEKPTGKKPLIDTKFFSLHSIFGRGGYVHPANSLEYVTPFESVLQKSYKNLLGNVFGLISGPTCGALASLWFIKKLKDSEENDKQSNLLLAYAAAGRNLFYQLKSFIPTKAGDTDGAIALEYIKAILIKATLKLRSRGRN